MLQQFLPINDQYWNMIKDGDYRGMNLFLKHYSNKNQDRKVYQFVGPGQKLVLLTDYCDALFVWRKFITDNNQNGVNCAVFRNESKMLSSTLILEACDIAWKRWPNERLYTYVDASKIRSVNPGYCFKQAGFYRCGITKVNKLVIFPRLPTY